MSLVGKTLKHSTDFPKPRGTRVKVRALLSQLSSGGVRSRVGKYYRTPAWKAMEQRFDGQIETTKGYQAFFKDLAVRLDSEIVIDEQVAKIRIKLPELGGAGSWFEVLELATRRANLHWFIDGQGRIALQRMSR